MAKVGYSNEWSSSSWWDQDGSKPRIYLRVKYSATYDPKTNTSTITVTPQVKTGSSGSVPYCTLYNRQKDSTAGVWGNGNQLFEFSYTYGGSSKELYLSSVTTSYTSFPPENGSISTFTVSHGADGKATFTVGVRGTFRSDFYGSDYLPGLGSKTSDSIELNESAPYKIIYDANLGTGAPSSQNMYHGVTYTISATIPTRTGYTFLGWSTSSAASTPEYQPGSTYTCGASNLNLYAVWSINSYTLTVEANPSHLGTITIDGIASSSKILPFNSTTTLVATPVMPTGYTTAFTSWSISGAGSLSNLNTSNTTLTMGAGNALASAYFTSSANKYYVNFNANGGYNTMSNQEFTYDVENNLNPCNFGRNNYKFIHWNTKADDTGISYDDKASILNLIPSGTITLYAIWELEGYPIIYHANGHGTDPEQQLKFDGQDLTLRAFISQQTEDDPMQSYIIIGNANGGTWDGEDGFATSSVHNIYTQIQWNTDSSGNGIAYDQRAIYSANASMDLWAIWASTQIIDYTYTVPSGTPHKIETATITFDANGGEFAPAAPTIIIKTDDCTTTGWYTQPIGGVERNSESQVTASETVYAQYVTPTFESATALGQADCSKLNMDLIGWATSSSATSPQYSPGATFIPIGDETYYAIWGESGEVYIGNKKYKIFVYNANNGVWEQYRAYIATNSEWRAY